VLRLVLELVLGMASQVLLAVRWGVQLGRALALELGMVWRQLGSGTASLVVLLEVGSGMALEAVLAVVLEVLLGMVSGALVLLAVVLPVEEMAVEVMAVEVTVEEMAVVVKVAETVVAGKMAEIAVETTMEVMAVAEMAVEVMAVEVMAVEVMAVGLSSPRWRIGLIQEPQWRARGGGCSIQKGIRRARRRRDPFARRPSTDVPAAAAAAEPLAAAGAVVALAAAAAACCKASKPAQPTPQRFLFFLQASHTAPFAGRPRFSCRASGGAGSIAGEPRSPACSR